MKLIDNGLYSNRVKTLDAMKGFLIIAVVLVHLLANHGRANFTVGLPPNPIFDSNPVVMAGYLCVLTFFIISGYFFKRGVPLSENLKNHALKLFIAVVICILVLPIALYVYLYAISQNPSLEMYFETHIVPIFGCEYMLLPYGSYPRFPHYLHIEVGYFFLQTMVTAFVIFYLLIDRIIDDLKKIVISIAVLVTITFFIRQFLIMPPLYLDLAPIAASLMIIGAKLGDCKFVERIEDGGWKSKRFAALLLISLIIASVTVFLFPTGFRFNVSIFGEYDGFSVYPFFITTIASCAVFFCIFVFVAKIPVFSDLLCLFGRHTLGILLLHTFVCKILIAPFYQAQYRYDYPVMPISITLLVWIAALVISLVASIYGQKLLNMMQEKITNKQ